jgi:hypothetical protein
MQPVGALRVHRTHHAPLAVETSDGEAAHLRLADAGQGERECQGQARGTREAHGRRMTSSFEHLQALHEDLYLRMDVLGAPKVVACIKNLAGSSQQG